MTKTIKLTEHDAGLLVYFLHKAEVLQSGHNDWCRLANKMVKELQTKIAKPFIKEPSINKELPRKDCEEFGEVYGYNFIDTVLEELNEYYKNC